MKKKNRFHWVYCCRNNQELTESYDQWAKEYDSDVKQSFAWCGPQYTVEFFARYVPREAEVLDAGAGTGLVGELLVKLGYKNLVAMDLSRGMLEEARKKNVYKELHQMIMGKSLDFAADRFGAVVCTGVFAVGHAPANSLDELVRITKPGSYIVFTLGPDVYENNGFREKQSALELESKWRLIEVSEKFQPVPKGEPEVYHQVWVYQVTSY
jgi:SAM-dependent methyltransferase